MLKLKHLLFSAILLMFGCAEVDVPVEVTDRLDDLEDRVTVLEDMCRVLNSDIAGLRDLVQGLESGDYITDVIPVTEGGVEVGYTIVFAEGDAVNIYHGKDGIDVGTAPQIGIRQDTDGGWYWIVNGEWLLDDKGNKVKAAGSDGKDGVTPLLKIDDDYWYVSYDNGLTWAKLDKATGEDGKDGDDGADGSNAGISIFSDVKWDSDYVYFYLNDGTVITIPKKEGAGLSIRFSVEQGTAIVPESSVRIEYTVSGGDENTLVRVVNADNAPLYGVVKQQTADSGYIIVYLEDWYDEEEMDEAYGDGYLGTEDLTYRDVYYSNMVLVISVSDGKGNQIIKALNFTEGKITSISDAYVADATAGTVTASVNTNVEYDVVVPEEAQKWLKYVPTAKADMRTDELKFSVTANDGDSFRSAAVLLENDMGQLLETFTIVQKTAYADKTVEFADPKVESVCLSRFDSDKNGKLTYEEVATVTDVDGLFAEQTLIESFDEFEYFTSVSAVPSDFFLNCERLKSVRLPESVKRIGDGAFNGCTSLKSIVIPEAVTEIPSYVFYGCSALSSVVLHDKITSIGEFAFAGSALEGELIEGTEIEALVIPENITRIGYRAFDDCDGFSNVKMESSVVPEVGYHIFKDGTTIYVPAVSLDDYKDAFGDEYAVLPYDMWSFTMNLEISSIETIFSYGELCNHMTITVSADLSEVSDAVEYGVYVTRYDGNYTERFPIDVVNEETAVSCSLWRDWYEYDYDAFVASADVAVGVYLILNDETCIHYDEREMQLVYDQKPSVKFTDVDMTSSESDCAYYTLGYMVEGSLWMERNDYHYDGDGHVDISWDFSDGLHTTEFCWSYWSAPISMNIYCTYNDNDYTTCYSNYLMLSLDDSGNLSARIADGIPTPGGNESYETTEGEW